MIPGGSKSPFPRDKILARIDRIKNMKDGLSLDELATIFPRVYLRSGSGRTKS